MAKQLIGLFLAAVLVATCSAECNDMQRLMVKGQWARAFGISHERAEMQRSLWQKVFKANPNLVPLFARVRGNNIYSPEFKAHAARLFGGFDLAISAIDQPDVFAAELAHLNAQHKKYADVKPEYYPVLYDALMEVVSDKLGNCFNKAAWQSCGKLISDGIAA